MDKKTIIYIGGFELPDKNAAAHRVISNGKLLRDIGYNVHFMGISNERGYNNKSYYGASLKALEKLGKQKKYSLVGVDKNGVNAFFILHDEVVRHKINLKDIKEIYRPPKYGDVWDGVPRGWALNRREMSDI